jgi:DNA-binding CsgD family transcriptional regulator
MGRTAEAEALLREGLEIALDGSSVLLELWARQGLAVLYAEAGRLADARSHLDRCRAVLAQGEDWRGLAGRIALAEAAVAAAAGRSEQSDVAFQRAIECFRRYTLPWDEAEALHLWGRALLAAGQRARAREQLDGAAEVYRRHGAGEPWIARVQVDQARIDGKSSAGRLLPTYPAGLTEREVEVLRLLATGKSNREISAALVISLNTVERHINHIFQKTDVANRVEAARYADRHGLTG